MPPMRRSDEAPFEATVLGTFRVRGRGTFVEIEIVRGTISRGSFVSIETSAGVRVTEVHAVEFVDRRLPAESHVALGVSGLDEHVVARVGGNVRGISLARPADA